MRKLSLALALVPMVVGTPAAAATVFDPKNDFLDSYIFDHDEDLDVLSFSVDFNAATETFLFGAALAAEINPARPGFYVIGANTGTGAIDPFDAIGQGNVTFDQVIVVQKDGSVSIGSTALSATIVGNLFTLTVPLSLLPSTGADPQNYGFNIWPRFGATVTGNDQISDFAPENALLSPDAVVPEPATWLMMLLGFGLAGTALRFRRTKAMPQQV
jgi:hypothetical protein